jgi:hypothetical protein
MDELLQAPTGSTISVSYPTNFRCDKRTQDVSEIPLTKKLRYTYDKREEMPDRSTRPFGFSEQLELE